MLLSIIIPVYNVEKYVAKCLYSCMNQIGVSSDDYEIVIVNDGTPDNSMKIVEDVLSQDGFRYNVKIINQKNGGLSAARNTGIRNASGKYVWFVDSDDWIAKDSVKHITKALEDDIDILQIQYDMVFEDEVKYFSVNRAIINDTIPGAECMRKQRLPNLAQSRVIRREYLINNDIFFAPRILHEDAEFKPRAVWPAKSIKSIPQVCYYYLKRNSNSITASFSRKNAEGRIYGARSMHEYSKNFTKSDQQAFNPDINFNLVFVIHEYPKLQKEDKKYILQEIKDMKPIFKRLRKYKSLKLALVYILLTINPSFVMRTYDKIFQLLSKK